jgi:hypothetical protein
MQETRVRGLTVLDPTSEPMPQVAEMAPAVDRLAGKRVGLLNNGKRNGDRILDEVLKILSAEGQPAEVIRRMKDNVSKPAAPDIIEELAASCDYVITAIGD